MKSFIAFSYKFVYCKGIDISHDVSGCHVRQVVRLTQLQLGLIDSLVEQHASRPCTLLSISLTLSVCLSVCLSLYLSHSIPPLTLVSNWDANPRIKNLSITDYFTVPAILEFSVSVIRLSRFLVNNFFSC